MSEKNSLNSKGLIKLIIIILILNTVSILVVFFALSHRINNQERNILQILKLYSEINTGNQNHASEIELPESNYQTLGLTDAPVKMQIITDLECPHCQKLYDMLFPAIEDSYIKMGLVELSYDSFPLDRHPKAMPAASILYCADKQGEFWQVFKYLSENINEMDTDQMLSSVSEKFKMGEALKLCADDTKTEEAIRKRRQELSSAGIKGTPSIIVDGYKLNGIKGYNDIKSAINKKLQSKTKTVSLAEAERLLTEGFRAIDVRTEKEVAGGYIENSINIDILQYQSFIEGINKLDKTGKYLVYCKSGTRSSWAWHVMKAMGFEELVNMKAGFDGWVASGRSIKK